MLGLPRGTVKSRTSRGLRRLARALEAATVDDVARTLADLGRRLDLPDGHDPPPRPWPASAPTGVRRCRISTRRGRRARIRGLAAAVVALVVVVAAPGPVAPSPACSGSTASRSPRRGGPGLGPALDLGEPEPLDDAQAQFGGVSLAGLGLPGAAYAGRPAGAVSLVWRASGDLSEIGGTGAGAGC